MPGKNQDHSSTTQPRFQSYRQCIGDNAKVKKAGSNIDFKRQWRSSRIWNINYRQLLNMRDLADSSAARRRCSTQGQQSKSSHLETHKQDMHRIAISSASSKRRGFAGGNSMSSY
jgi:hypothetical protein